jgi:hypothetical protein
MRGDMDGLRLCTGVEEQSIDETLARLDTDDKKQRASSEQPVLLQCLQTVSTTLHALYQALPANGECCDKTWNQLRCFECPLVQLHRELCKLSKEAHMAGLDEYKYSDDQLIAEAAVLMYSCFTEERMQRLNAVDIRAVLDAIAQSSCQHRFRALVEELQSLCVYMTVDPVATGHKQETQKCRIGLSVICVCALSRALHLK